MKNNTKTIKIFSVASTVSGLLWSPPQMAVLGLGYALSTQIVHAQPILEEIIVTARKREESLQTIPVAASAFSASDLEVAGATNIVDIAYSVPNLSLQDRGGSFGTSFGVRGISSNSRNAGIEDSVALYVDGVYVGRPQFFRIDTADIQQIEVLRGPQGTLFGKNAVAGALNISTKAPNTEGLEGEVQAKVGNYGATRLAGYVSGPFSDSVAGKLTFTKNDSDGWIDNRFNGETLQGVDDVFVRGVLAIAPADKVNITLSADYTDADNKTVFSQPIVGVAIASPEQIGDQLDDHTAVFRDGPAFDKVENTGVSLSVDYALESEYSLSFIAATRAMDFEVGFDDDNSSRDFSNSIFSDSADQSSFEARINSPAWDGWDFVAGVLWFDQEVDSVRGTGPGVDTPGPSAFGLITGAGGVDTSSIGVYFHSTTHLTEALNLSIGVRWTEDEKEGEWEQDTFDPVAAEGIIPPDASVPRVSRTWSEVTPSLALVYNIDDDSIAYAKYVEGFKGGSMLSDIINISSPDEFILEPETVESYEMGYKTTLLGGSMRLNSAIFYMDYQNLQVINLSNLQGGGFIGSNAGSADLKGLELEMVWAATDNFTLTASAGLLDAEYQDLIRANQDLSGNEPRNAPDTTGNLQGQYSLPLQDGGSINLVGNMAYRSAVFYDPENNDAIRQGGYSLVNARVGYASADGSWSAYLWGKNLSDKKYATFGRLGPFGQTQLSFGTPRTYGIEATYRF